MTATRYEGRLAKWNAERGFGFIASADSGEDVFVHISAFPRNGREPAVDEWLSFEVEPDGKGRKRAVRVRRRGGETAARAPSSRRAPVRLSRTPKAASPMGKLVVVALLAAMGWAGYSRLTARLNVHGAAGTAPPIHAPVSSGGLPGASKLPVPPDFRCDGRQYCSQMTSCREATLFLQNCPGTKMDGNHDGVPCEQQWCG